MRGTWPTTGSGVSGRGTAVLVIFAVTLPGPAAAAAIGLLHVLVIMAAVHRTRNRCWIITGARTFTA
jgi:hypothetical protein